jgi:hypothetical protein
MAAGEVGGVWGTCQAPLDCFEAGEVPEASTPDAPGPEPLCGGSAGCAAIPGEPGIESTFTCQTCTYYSEFGMSAPNLGPLTGCVSNITQPMGWPAEIVMCGHDWSINFTCVPVDPSVCMQ